MTTTDAPSDDPAPMPAAQPGRQASPLADDAPPSDGPSGTAAGTADPWTPSSIADDLPGPAGTAPLPGSPGSASPAAEGPGFLETLPWWTVPLILIGVPVAFALVAQAVPDFYEDVVWKHYWGPIKADAMNCGYLSSEAPDRCALPTAPGVLAQSGYNPVNTLSWAVLLGVCILGIAQMLAVFRTTMDDKLILAATAWVVVGSVAHVLEDAGLFSGWLQYLFITPPIYLLFGAFGVGSFLVGQWMRSMAVKADLHAALRLLWLVHVVLVLVWLGLWWKGWEPITHYVHPLWVALFAVLNFALARFVVLRQGKVDPSLMTLVLSLGTYLLVGAYIVSYVVDPWNDLAGEGMVTSFLLAPLLAVAAAAVVYALARKAPKVILGLLLVGGSALAGVAVPAFAHFLLGRLHGLTGIAFLGTLRDGLERPVVGVAIGLAVALYVGVRAWQKHRGQAAVLTPLVAVAYAVFVNLLLIFSQMLDAFATALGIDLNGYTEKHVLSAEVIDAFRDFSTTVGWSFGALYPTFLAFVPVKFMISLLVVWAIDVHSREDARQHPTMIGLVKFAIIMVGIGPGVRDFTRLSLGV